MLIKGDMFLMNSFEYHLNVEIDGAGQKSVYISDKTEHKQFSMVVFMILKKKMRI